MTSPADTSEKPSTIDRLVQVWQARSPGTSPASVALAYYDWLLLLGTSPGKQVHLLEEAWRDAMRISTYAAHSADPLTGLCLEPQDQHFTSAEW